MDAAGNLYLIKDREDDVEMDEPELFSDPPVRVYPAEAFQRQQEPDEPDLRTDIAVPGDFRYACVNSAGNELFVMTHQKGIWRVPLQKDFSVQKGSAEQLVPTVALVSTRLLGPAMLSTGPLLWFWSSCKLWRMDLTTKPCIEMVNVEEKVANSWDEPSYALDAAASVLNIKPKSEERTVLGIDLATKRETHLTIPDPWIVMHSQRIVLRAATGDGKLVLDSRVEHGSAVHLWDPAKPEQNPTRLMQTLWVESAVVDAKGDLWLAANNQRDDATDVNVVHASLVAPLHLKEAKEKLEKPGSMATAKNRASKPRWVLH